MPPVVTGAALVAETGAAGQARSRDGLPVVCVFGALDIALASARDAPAHETTALDCHCFADDSSLEHALIAHDPHVIVSIGPRTSFPKLETAPFEVRRRWLHFDDAADPDAIGAQAFACYLAASLAPAEEYPLVSIVTPTYRTGARFARALASVHAQTYRNWEWVLLDDSDDGGATHAMLAACARGDHRIRVLPTDRHSGVIGAVKRAACMAARGALLVELDHDDALTARALERIVAAARLYPGAGFFYSDFAELDAAGQPLRYPDGWGAGFGRYREETHDGQALAVAIAPAINPRTIRALVACPNHVRAWRWDVYQAIGGHNRRLAVADDFDLLIRTFLATRMVHIPQLCYLQYRDGYNTQTLRNADIQRHVRHLRQWHDMAIHARFAALGIPDWAWDASRGACDMTLAPPPSARSASLVAALG